MSTTEFKEAILAPYTNKIPLVLLTLNNTEWDEPLYLVGNNANITSNGIVYEAVGMSFVAPATGATVSTIKIEDVSQNVVATFRSKLGDVFAVAKVILAHDPDTIQLGPWNLSVGAINIQGSTITLNMTQKSILRNSLGGARITPNNFPALYV